MIINKNIKKQLTLTLIISVGVSIFSCDFDRDENENNLYNNEAINKRVQVNIEEAKIMSDIAILNETLIAMSDSVKGKSNNYHVKNISNKLKKDNLKIKKSLNELAEKKLILLPNKIDENEILELHENEKADFSEIYLKKIEALLKNQITQLEYLSNITNDVDFKVLTVKILVNLNYNLNQTQKILKTNY
ncbi:DUF4142 domain-containing protein [Mariniflexile gromovii]|uniref:DUF4142 domain-containing protein n=1 Tax=Mariniflexile gromovii TaxID=362523 RepID=A0ABS4BY49_9FLAO|nr:DUF4142 domain-containing protein [Mariniflexile gromovii]MBP0905512.1 DUF4142 domain-containing protein [Mariniflexile gromovii]